MSKPILDPAFWHQRLQDVRGNSRLAIHNMSGRRWAAAEEVQQRVLSSLVHSSDTLLDIGCGFGRIVGLLPVHAGYTGIDVSPDFLEIAKHHHPDKTFILGNILDLPLTQFPMVSDWAIVCDFRNMIIGNLGQPYWDQIQSKALTLAKRILFLENNTHDPASILCNGVEVKLEISNA